MSFFLIPIIALILYAPLLIIFISLVLWGCVAGWEFLRLYKLKQYFAYLFVFMGISLFLLTHYLKIPLTYALAAYFMMIAIGWIIFDSFEHWHRILLIFFTPIYLGWLPGHLILLKELSYQYNYWFLLFPFVITWINDTGAYFIGRRWGRQPLVPSLSPKKTWEGAFCGLGGAVVASILYSYIFMPKISIWFAILSALILGGLAELGDIFESGFKREAKVKDSSKLLSAHGGVLDRMDSLLFTIPGFYYFHSLYFCSLSP